MKYNITEFKSAVRYYKKKTKNTKNALIVFDINNTDAYYSIAPLSRALHENSCDIFVFGRDGRSGILQCLYKTWLLYERMKKGEKTPATKALKEYINYVKKKAKGFEKLFVKPDLILKSSEEGFVGSKALAYKKEWHAEHKKSQLTRTANVIFKQVYNLKKGERTGIGFELIAKKKDMDAPLEDYLDNFGIAMAMMLSAKRYGRVSMSAATNRYSMLKPMNKISDLKTTLTGSELSKNIDEPIFKKFRTLSKYIGSDNINISDASFFIAGKGYNGKHLFGQAFGYPDPKKKTRWQSPGMFIYQLSYSPQSTIDERKPLSRVGFTSTLPMDIFIKTCNIDWLKMKKKNDKLKKIAAKAEKFVVKSNITKDHKSHMTEFEVSLIKKNGERRLPKGSDVSIRNKINPTFKKKGIYAGNMSNLPGGEMFVTPENVNGTIVGDVIISIDQSYKLNHKKPIVVSSNNKGYKIITGPKKILEKIKQKKKEAKQNINKSSIPEKIKKLKRKNFNLIGEFAINTNPKAELCDYLIVNEKIAGMIHVALGSGFEADRTTGYHYDIVINAKRQKLDIYALSKGKKIWVMKKGRLLV